MFLEMIRVLNPKEKMKTRFYPFISDKGMCFNQRWTFTLMLKII
ncbi:hypothetical protein J5O10_003235 [Clostridioides difficile]|uniref:Uncharacterized protein n=2 Tax=Clostridioides difficile TaxID=1496 RepID=D5Q0J2_CLODI|nr:hypothetical protein [Clostridioides difficile]EFH08558.1 hypothetical protein HMPREF0220_0424 [Clostridioides difficile NAP08]EFH14218.1 hypothetical protein HMPREF0219_3143 [Clostridioides difficile NAP07]MDV9847637.1 hypothetical protein [Clostridioides difficile]WAX75039.1 hypothetical protein J5O10_003235 [Clostridioides difficile]